MHPKIMVELFLNGGGGVLPQIVINVKIKM